MTRLVVGCPFSDSSDPVVGTHTHLRRRPRQVPLLEGAAARQCATHLLAAPDVRNTAALGARHRHVERGHHAVRDHRNGNVRRVVVVVRGRSGGGEFLVAAGRGSGGGLSEVGCADGGNNRRNK